MLNVYIGYKNTCALCLCKNLLGVLYVGEFLVICLARLGVIFLLCKSDIAPVFAVIFYSPLQFQTRVAHITRLRRIELAHLLYHRCAKDSTPKLLCFIDESYSSSSSLSVSDLGGGVEGFITSLKYLTSHLLSSSATS